MAGYARLSHFQDCNQLVDGKLVGKQDTQEPESCFIGKSLEESDSHIYSLKVKSLARSCLKRLYAALSIKISLYVNS